MAPDCISNIEHSLEFRFLMFFLLSNMLIFKSAGKPDLTRPRVNIHSLLILIQVQPQVILPDLVKQGEKENLLENDELNMQS